MMHENSFEYWVVKDIEELRKDVDELMRRHDAEDADTAYELFCGGKTEPKELKMWGEE